MSRPLPSDRPAESAGDQAADVLTPRSVFAVASGVVVFALALLYALAFSHMIYDSLMEQVFARNPHPPRHAGTIHHHNAAEWVLLVSPAALGWLGAGGSLYYLVRRGWRR